MYANCVLACRVSLLSLHPIPQWVALEGCTAVALMADDDARQARPMTTIEQAVCTGERNLRAHADSPTPYPTVGGTGGLNGSGADGRAWRRKTGKQAVCAHLWRAQQAVPTSTDRMVILKNTREFKAPGAGKEHTSEVRGGGRDPGVRRPGSIPSFPF